MWFKGVSRTLHGNFKVIKGCFKHVSRKLQECVKSISMVFQESFKECCKEVSRGFQGFFLKKAKMGFRDILSIFQDCFRGVLRKLHLFF